MRSGQNKLLTALRKRMRVTRKTAIENGWAENVTAAISKLRKKGYVIEAISAKTPEGKSYTRYRLISEPLPTKQAA